MVLKEPLTVCMLLSLFLFFVRIATVAVPAIRPSLAVLAPRAVLAPLDRLAAKMPPCTILRCLSPSHKQQPLQLLHQPINR
jgi:hypothetical protein